jgi:hypothetical protein
MGTALVPTTTAVDTPPSVKPTPAQNIPIIAQPTSVFLPPGRPLQSSRGLVEPQASPVAENSDANIASRSVILPFPNTAAQTLILPKPIPASLLNNPVTVTLVSPAGPGRPGQVVTLTPTSTQGIPAVIVGMQVLIPGLTITIGGTTSVLANGQSKVVSGVQLVLDPPGQAVVVGGTTTVDLGLSQSIGASPHITVNGEVIAANSASQFVIGGQTLTAGGTIIVAGTRVSLDALATAIVIDEISTIELQATRTTVCTVIARSGSYKSALDISVSVASGKF